MNQPHQHFQEQRIELGVESANLNAWQMRANLGATEWRSAVNDLRMLPYFATLQSDPYTSRAYTKPRGYPGDAVMLDYLYTFHPGDAAPNLDANVHRIFQYTINSSAGKAVRFRRKFLANLIDDTANRHADVRILSIAAGHLREVELSSALTWGKVKEIVAFDQDEESLKVIDRDYAHLPIRTVPGTVRHLLVGKTALGQFHLVYAAGLFDYLDDDIAKRLIQRMWAMTLPGGRAMIANFMPDIPDVGYMEAFMDWWLIYRDGTQVQALFSDIPAAEIAEMRVEFDPGRNICFLVAQRAL